LVCCSVFAIYGTIFRLLKATDLTKFESESLELKQKVESLLIENSKLVEKLKQAESDLATNRR